ncbi:hypothetical protein GGI42DRAFT_188379 [Trichoderma sp. SZMC 28013]
MRYAIISRLYGVRGEQQISGGGRLSELCRLCFASPLIRAACTSKYREAKCGGEQERERDKVGSAVTRSRHQGWGMEMEMEHVSVRALIKASRCSVMRSDGRVGMLLLSSSFFLPRLALFFFFTRGFFRFLSSFAGGFDLGFLFLLLLFSRLRQNARTNPPAS